MRDPWDESELARRFRESASTSLPRAPLYAALSAGISRDRSLHGLLFHARPEQRLPVMLFAAVHSILLVDPSHPLAEWYPNLTEAPRAPGDAALLPTFAAFVDDHAPEILSTLQSRTVQTNEVGRCGLLLPVLSLIGDETGSLALLDVGTSAGLTMQLDRYTYRYIAEDGSTVEVGGPSTVVIDVNVRGDGPTPRSMPDIATRHGIDLHPIDVADDAEARWLQACVWPDQTERFARLRAAIDIARDDPPRIIVGDAVASVGPALHETGADLHPVVTNSWALNYLDHSARLDYVAQLDAFGSDRDTSWVFAEAPALTSGLPWNIEFDDPHLTVVTLVTWRSGIRTVRHVASAHPHGYWMHWQWSG